MTTHAIETIEQLEAYYPGIANISPATWGKETAKINDDYRRLIEACPFATVATEGPEGLDCSPRGDGPGFIRIIDQHTIALPDRRGNNRLDTLRNIVRTGRVALLLMIPGLNETVRINGRALVSVEPDLLESMAEQGKVPASAILVTIETMYFQCARAIIRSRLWQADAQVDPKTLPSAGQLVRSVMADFDSDSYDAVLPERQAKTLY
ncbi:pyridoxamine 5'-phosphate oxidase family protein [Pseudahrensia aquimaris]|uniref:Pyridoxamine 5'-phosphate oxidase family protein n=1 Tax=Pseudahrensia aquimaris TaxID=744461 RepID=A0ABW3FG64_9HYPH